MQRSWDNRTASRSPHVLFLQIRRAQLLTLLVVSVTVLFFALIPVSYGIPPLNNVRETPVFRVLPAVVGILCASSVNPVGSDQELLRGCRARNLRSALPFLLLFLALVTIALTGWLFSLVYPDQEVLGVIAPMLTSTVIFTAVGIISACYLTGSWQVIPTAALFLVLVGFGFQTFITPYAWNIFFHISAPIALIAGLSAVLAFLALRHRY